MANFIKNLTTDLSSTVDIVDLELTAFVKETNKFKVKLDLSVIASNSYQFWGHTAAQPRGVYLEADSMFINPGQFNYDQTTDNFTIDFWQFALSNTKLDAEVLFSINEKDSSGSLSNIVQNKNHTFNGISTIPEKTQIAYGEHPYRDSWGGNSLLFGEKSVLNHPISLGPEGSYSVSEHFERGRHFDSTRGTSVLISDDVLDSAITTHIQPGGWYKSLGSPDETISTAAKSHRHRYGSSNIVYNSVDDGLDNLTMQHVEGIRIRGLDWSYAGQKVNSGKWEAIGADLDLTAPKAGVITIDGITSDSSSSSIISNTFLLPDSDRLYATNDSINNSYFTGKRNVITGNFDTYKDATFGAYVWLDPTRVDQQIIFKAGDSYEALELKVSGSNFSLSAGNGSIACQLPIPGAGGDNNALGADSPDIGSFGNKGNRWHELRWSVQLFPGKVTLMTKKIGSGILVPGTSNVMLHDNGHSDVRIASHEPNPNSGIRRWAAGQGPGGIAEFKVKKNQATMGALHQGDRRAYATAGMLGGAVLRSLGPSGVDPFRTDNTGNLFIRPGDKLQRSYSILKSAGDFNDKIIMENCGTSTNLNPKGRILYFETHNKGSSGNLYKLNVANHKYFDDIVPFVSSFNMVHQGTANSGPTTNTINTNNTGNGNRVVDHTGYPNLHTFPTLSKGDQNFGSYIIDEQAGMLYTFDHGEFVSGKPFATDKGADTHLELGFQFNYYLNWWRLLGEPPSPYTQHMLASFNVNGFRGSIGTEFEGTPKGFLLDPEVKKNIEIKVALIKEDWFYDPVKLVNQARSALTIDPYVSDGIFNATTGATNPNNISQFYTPQTPVGDLNVRTKFLKTAPFVPLTRNSITGDSSQQFPLADHLIYYDQGYHPTAGTGKTDEWQNSHITWAGRSAKFKGTEHGINTSRAYILKTGGSTTSHNTGLGTNLTTIVASLDDGDCLLLEPGNYTLTGAFGGTVEQNSPAGARDFSQVTPFGKKSIMICGNTDNIKSVHITYDAGVTTGPAPIFGPFQDDFTALAFLTFKKVKYTGAGGTKDQNYALVYHGNGCKAYKVLFDFDKQPSVELVFNPQQNFSYLESSPKLGTRTVFTKCVFTNYGKFLTENDASSGTPWGPEFSHVKLIDPIFTKNTGVSAQTSIGSTGSEIGLPDFSQRSKLSGIDITETIIEPWWNINDFSAIMDSQILTSPFIGYGKDFHLHDNISRNINGARSIVDPGPRGTDINNSVPLLNEHVMLQFTQPLNTILTGVPTSALSSSWNSTSNNIMSWDLGGGVFDSSLQIATGLTTTGSTLLSFDTLGQLTHQANRGRGYNQREIITTQVRDSTGLRNISGVDIEYGWTHTAISVEQNRIRTWKDGAQISAPIDITHLPIKDAKLFIGAGNQTGKTSSAGQTTKNKIEFKSFKGFIHDFRIQTGLQFADSFEMWDSDQSTGNTLVLSTSGEVINSVNAAKGLKNIGSVLNLSGAGADSVSMTDITPFTTAFSGVNWYTTGVHQSNYSALTKHVSPSAGQPPYSGSTVSDPTDGILNFELFDSYPASWENAVDSGQPGYVPGLQVKLRLFNTDNIGQSIDWKCNTVQWLEPAIDIKKDSQYISTDFYINDRWDSGRDGLPGSVFLEFDGKVRGTRGTTDVNPSIYIDNNGTILSSNVGFTARYDRSGLFGITTTPSNHILRYVEIDELPQGGFAINGISSFDSYIDNTLPLQVIQSVGGLV